MIAKRTNKRFFIVASILFAGLCLIYANTLSAASTKTSKSETIWAGKAVYDAQGCNECHQINGQGGEAGPDISHVGSKENKIWLRKQITDSKAHFKNSYMPAYKDLPKKDLDALVTYLSSLK
jgi:cbb3-type cytochrome oxidase cytochrome c subunit